MKKLIVAIVIAVAAPMFLAASADAGSRHKSDCARAKKAGKACVIDFGKGDHLEGSRISPDGDRFTGKRAVQFGNLLRLRVHWHDQIVKAADNI
jgi:hypothetical protein